MKAFKIFDADLKCRDFQYEIGKTYEIEGEIKLCGNGFHACKELVHCLGHYSPAVGNRLCEVELGGEILGIDEEKQCASKITIIKELSFFNSAAWGKYYCTDVETGKSKATNRSKATNFSEATNNSEATNGSKATNWSKATNNSEATNWSKATNISKATNCSMLIHKCKGVNESILCAGLDHSYYLFNKKVTKERINEVKEELTEFGWLPKFLNFEQLREKYGNDIKMLPIDRLKELQTKEAYADMPADMVEYIKSLPEYGDKIFNEIRGMGEQ